MSLIEAIDNYFREYDRRTKKLRDCVVELLEILNDLIEDPLVGAERDKLKDTIISLDTHLDTIVELADKADLTREEKEEFQKSKRIVKQVIIDFRHGDILKRYHTKNSATGVDITTRRRPDSGDDQNNDRGIVGETASGEAAIKNKGYSIPIDDDPMHLAIKMARQSFPRASDSFILKKADEYRRLASMAGGEAKEEWREAGAEKRVRKYN